MTDLMSLMTSTPGLPCRDEPDAFYSSDATERAYAARQCQQRCPLILACMRYALEGDEQHGVWGGVDFEARAMGCGTERGYQVHIRRREDVCPRCRAAHDEAVEANRRRLLAEAHRAGGTVRGYWMHRRLLEDACAACKRAQARKSAERREEQRAAGDKARAEWDARKAADPLQGAPVAVQPASRAA